MNLLNVALAKIEFLEERGFQIHRVIMESADKTVSVDSWGRVVWEKEEDSE